MRELNDRVAMWQTYVQTTESVSNRVESINRYMALVQIAIFSSYFIVADLPDSVSMAVGCGGAIVGVIWLATIHGYMLTYRTKLYVIVDMERRLPVSPITQESAVMKKAIDPDGEDEAFWQSVLSNIQMMVVSVVTGIHLIAMTWFGWSHALPSTYVFYDLGSDSNLALWLSLVALVVTGIGLWLLHRFKDQVPSFTWYLVYLIVGTVGLASAMTLATLHTYGIP